ncbi:MAG: type I restriction endonuclease subunit R [Leptolyngbya sp. SIO1E4]|nr:type I restriction endonuclease subunit R [Leptolyngbya sp. SIO1E4]
MTTDMSERGLETLIERSLMEASGYFKGKPSDYVREFCLDKVQLLEFLRTTQPQAINRLTTTYGEHFEDRLFKRISDQIKSRGIIEVLRKGIKAQEVSLTLYYKQPASQLNPDATARYAANRFSVTRQLRYSDDNKQLALDLVILVNGLPLITFELKNQVTRQSVKDAMRQYQKDRDPKATLFQFGRCLVHFAVDDELVYMTTHLKGEATRFLPFNQGRKSNPDEIFPDSAGNPVNPDGIATDYLWKKILTKSSLSNIVENYAQIVEEEADDGSIKRKLIFPRYHQLYVVRQLLAQTKENGLGHRYLIQHSAGSGKSNSITWLSHQLVELTDRDSVEPVFDSVIVVTDRVVLDKQIRNNIKQFAQVKGVVQAVTEGSRQLRKALEDGKKLIITTVDKFAYVVEEIDSLKSNRFAVIIDEAHSSQSGSKAASMSAALSKDTAKPTETTEDKILQIIEAQQLCQNASYYAFTATPKNKTLELFGWQNPIDGKFYPHHLYSMKQAIEEGFILDVLQNYTPYNSYYQLQKKIEDDPKFDTQRAKQKLLKNLEESPYPIQAKTKVMVDHFLDEVMGQRKIDGRAKAMLVTRSIKSAVRYKLAFDAYLQEVKSPFQAIVAFSGSKEVDGKVEDEASMNGFPSQEIEARFKQSIYRFLIVADKYQTGFDQPLLHTMYVDKPLSDVKAVQTLSRLNRSYPGKTDTFILDFVNSVEQIKQSFEPFYTTTILSEATDLDRLNDLQDALDDFQVYSPDNVREFVRLFLEDVDRDVIEPILDTCKESYKTDLTADQQIDFKRKAKSFIRNYQFLVQVRTFKNPYWESLKTFLRFLVPKLPIITEEDLSQGVLESVDLESYRVEREMTQAILLGGEQELAPTPPEPRTIVRQPDLDWLSNIIREFNERFGNIDWTDEDKVRRLLFEDLPREISQDEEYLNAKQHSDRQNARITFEKKLTDKFQDHIFDQTEAYRQYTDNQEFKGWLVNTLFEMDYDQGLSSLNGERPSRRADNQRNPAIAWRGSKAGDLLKFAGIWAGDDLEECRQAVYENRSEADF